MGTILKVKNADFSENGMDLFTAKPIDIIKSALETGYYENLRYSSGYVSFPPSTNGGGNRNAFGGIDASSFDSIPFVLFPKAGCKIAPCQSNEDNTQYRWNLAWTTSARVFDSFSTYPKIGANLAYSNDASIAAGTSIWDFVDVALEPEMYITQYKDHNILNNIANTANAGWAFCEADQQKVRGKTINVIRFKASAAGNFAILVGSSMTTCTQRANVVVAPEEVGQTVQKTFNEITIGADEYLVVGTPNGAGMYYGNGIDGAGGFYSQIPSNPSQSSLTSSIGVDVGYMEQ